jgi:uncharacterized membrane protein
MRDFFRGRLSAGLLLASFALNIFLAGMLAAPHLFGPPPQPPLMPPPPRMVVERLADGLSEDGRHALLAAFDNAGGALDTLFAALVDSQSDLMREFANEAFDGAAYGRALEARKAAADRFFNAMSDFFRGVGGQLSVEDRRRIIERGRI